VRFSPIRKEQDFPGAGIHLTAPEPVGMRHVLVNGVPIRVDEKQCADYPSSGEAIRSEQRVAAGGGSAVSEAG
jgi:hypothetical protein